MISAWSFPFSILCVVSHAIEYCRSFRVIFFAKARFVVSTTVLMLFHRVCGALANIRPPVSSHYWNYWNIIGYERFDIGQRDMSPLSSSSRRHKCAFSVQQGEASLRFSLSVILLSLVGFNLLAQLNSGYVVGIFIMFFGFSLMSELSLHHCPNLVNDLLEEIN